MLEALLRRGLIGVVPLIAACSCPEQRVIRSPASLVGVTIPIAPSKAECEQLCGERITKCERIPVSTAPLRGGEYVNSTEYTVLCKVPPRCVGGRRPEGLADAAVAGGIGAHFAELARLEAASVHAFEELAVELELHGAPPALIEAARRAAIDEIDHAMRTAQLARLYGGVPAAPAVAPTAPRALAAVLVENAVEGLVQERYGTVLAAVRATRASDPAVRDAMSAIACDEAGHAALAAAIHDWGMARVTRAERRRVEEARARSALELRAQLDVEPSAALAMLTGMPSATLATELAATL